MYALHDVLHPPHVLGIGGPDEEVVRRLELRRERLELLRVQIGQVLEALGVAVGQLTRLQPLRLGGVGHRLAVLVGAGEEEHVLAALAHVPREHVGGDLLVRVAKVRLRVDVVDRGGDVKGHAWVEGYCVDGPSAVSAR